LPNIVVFQAQRYYEAGADEVTFLNITSFRNSPLRDQPMLEVLQRVWQLRRCFLPFLTHFLALPHHPTRACDMLYVQ